MAQKSLHWMDRTPDPNIQGSTINKQHTDRARISAATLLTLLTLKSKLLGKRLDVLAEAEAFEAKQA